VAVGADAGVVDHQVHRAAQPLLCGLGQLPHLLLGRDVAADGQSLAAGGLDGPDGLLRRGQVDVGAHHPAAAAGQLGRERTADAAAGTGHHRVCALGVSAPRAGEGQSHEISLERAGPVWVRAGSTWTTCIWSGHVCSSHRPRHGRAEYRQGAGQGPPVQPDAPVGDRDEGCQRPQGGCGEV
jgi:hypothetical protein